MALALTLLAGTGCGTTAAWHAGATFATDEERAPSRVEDVRLYCKPGFGVFETTKERRPQVCYSTTLLRKMTLVPGASADAPPAGDVVRVAELTTEEVPRDDEKSKLDDRDYTRVFGIGEDEFDRFEVAPSAWGVEQGLRRLKEMAASLGCDEVRDVFCTGYAEHQMWDGSALSLTPTSTTSPLYAHVHLLELRLRDVRFHGTAVRRKEARP